MANIHFELVTPEKLVRSGEAYMVVVPGTEGDLGIMAGHAPLMTTMRDAEMRIYATDGATPDAMMIRGGFAEVNDKGLTILAEAVG
ncbi:MAG: ATP synthase F1 subunit epsilon [Parasphingorhabdus sp.]|nr:ATP synthase F1 subunit epsilon [Parasphingorhabdus sp.]